MLASNVTLLSIFSPFQQTLEGYTADTTYHKVDLQLYTILQ